MTMSHGFGRLVSPVILVGAFLLASCSTSPSSPPTSGKSTTPTGPYGSLTLVTNFGNGHVDPFRDNIVGWDSIGSAVIDNLVYRDFETYEVKPKIAERWEISPDGKTHTFYIRKGVKFHDGSDLTGADVKFSIERMARATLQPDAINWQNAIAKVELKDDFTVAVQLKTPQFELIKGYDSAITAVLPKKYIEEKGDDYFAKNPVGSGPWKVVKFEPGVRLELEAVEGHWRATPQFKNLTILSIPEESTKVAMLKTGELDMAAISPDSVSGLESAGFRIVSYWSGGGYYGYPLYDIENPQKYAYADVRVRKAMQLAINSKELADKLFRGRAESVSVALEFVSSDSKANAYDSTLLKPDPYDPEAAKKLLAEAGYSNGFDTKMIDVGGGDPRSILSIAVAGYWRKIGINGEITPVDYGVFLPAMRARSPETWNGFYLFSAAGGKSWAQMIPRYHSTKSNSKNVKNPRLDWLLDNIPTTRDAAEKQQFELEAAKLAKNEYSCIAVLGMHNILALGNKVGDVAKQRFVREISGTMLETIRHAK
ncbi:MAG: ABC transporter substrate-binding protein [Dehalococcoidia bacterium]|nr:ABC transporter substrate-binding protein [Dehalococcoidia bacterium]